MLSLDAFMDYGRLGYTHVPLWQTFVLPPGVEAADIYQALANEGQDYLFETGQWHDGVFCPCYSVIGLPCSEHVELDAGLFRHYRDGQILRELACEDPLAELASFQQGFRVPEFAELPQFSGGLFGYFGFETTRLIEPRLRRAEPKPSGLDMPDVWQWLSTALIVLDHERGLAFCIVHEQPQSCSDYSRGLARLQRLGAQLSPVLVPATASRAWSQQEPSMPQFDFPREDYEQAVARIKEYIAAGDVMQVVLSQRMNMDYEGSALSLYRALCSLGPTPYRYLLNLGDCQIVGASPEMLFRQENELVTSRPMAGTRRRGAGAAEDEWLRDQLLADPKEIAEHMMLVDLARNDLGRLADKGSVQVERLLKVEYFSHVMHIVSTVTGRMPDTVSGLDLLRSTFPAGTLSGASKIRALEVIAELEPHGRGVYGGAIGWMDWCGCADLAIAIRTALLCAGRLHIQAGAGVVRDSLAAREWEETMEKSRVIRLAAARCEEALACT
ncbi:anthranilate synthase component I family protein [Chitinimonas sp.]|uniref:anthranilate synthase component I family protein n=1 Tax=Chitinimonas sp. TaxID=1934313 RepID=UPI0035B3C236